VEWPDNSDTIALISLKERSKAPGILHLTHTRARAFTHTHTHTHAYTHGPGLKVFCSY